MGLHARGRQIPPSAALGILLGAQRHLGVPSALVALAGVGFCGGLTTFSTLGYETMRLPEDGAVGAAGLNLLGSLAAGLLAAYLGYSLAAAFLGWPDPRDRALSART